ncbi:aftiphilin isoform X2 [Tachysurus vachellii]|uniref:aftiphilin isoform X2 n=1 Tax=Tachysurus vachellii TaxID=175792 RepID=UPI00296ABADE|nr:aftiphilin isoform X2 [Tachysurus vachellii]
MDPDVVRMYSSSPPPLDEDGEEEDEDDFGEFGGYCCDESSSFSFSVYDTTTAFGQSFETDTSPPDRYNTFTQSVGQPEKELALKEAEKIKDQEAPNLKSVVCASDDSVDSGNGNLEISTVLLNGPLSPDLQGEFSVDSATGKHITSEHQDFKLGDKDEHSNNPNCFSNGPITFCSGKQLVLPTVTSTNSTESVVVSRAEDSSTESDKAEDPIDSHEILKDSTSQTKVSEAVDTLAGDGVTETQEGDSSLEVEDQINKEKNEKEETEVVVLSGTCGPSSASFCKIQIQSHSEVLEDVADTLLAPVAENVPMFDTKLKENFENCNKAPVSPVVEGPLVVPGSVELEEDFEEMCLPVVDPTEEIDHDDEADPDVKEVKRAVVRSSMDSDEDFGDFRDDTQGFPDNSQTESLSQEGFADFVTALSDCSSHDEFADADTLKDLKEEDELAAEDKNDVNDNDDDTNNHETICTELPPSDSFADFSSAPFGGPASTTGESWAEFGQQEECEVQQESWAAFEEEQQSSTATAPSNDSLQTYNVLKKTEVHKLQYLFQITFPLEMAPDDSDVPTLQALLEPQDHAENRESGAMWRHLLDIHNAYGFKVQWVGSHSNRILLDCLGIYNILFTGQNKQPVIVPMFAAGLGMLEPTKEPVKPSSIFSVSSPGQGRSAVCTRVVSSLSLDDDGVDPELYELTTAKLESSNASSNVADAFTRLMETAEKSSTVTRKPEQDGEISQEAAQVISLLPNLSFMHARVLMFPSTLTPAASHP